MPPIKAKQTAILIGICIVQILLMGTVIVYQQRVIIKADDTIRTFFTIPIILILLLCFAVLLLLLIELFLNNKTYFSTKKIKQETNTPFELKLQRLEKEKETAIDHKIKAEKANQSKSIYLAKMSHEIRTPLQSIMGMLEMLNNEVLSPKQSQYVSTSVTAGKRLLCIINSILDLSQIESGKFELNHSAFSLSQVLGEVVELMNFQAQKKGISILAELPETFPNALLGDSGRIRQILINLVSNSIKFTNNGTISITAELQREINGTMADILFSIADSGDGISKSDQEKIFSTFERGRIKSEVVVEGAGLGLAISSEFVEHMGGRLWLAETGTSGSTFCFTIRCPIIHPVHIEEEQTLLPEKQKAKKFLAGIRVMLAEDEFINQRIITAYLEEMGALVTVCQDGRELLEKMQREQTDIILMDIRMPNMNGLEATKHIRRHEAETCCAELPIVALTAQATTDFEIQCRKVGMNDYLTKPVPFNTLVDIILKLTTRQNQQQNVAEKEHISTNT